MKVLSLTEPFATLILNGDKRIETRCWKTNYRGELYIHASKTKISPKDFNDCELMALVKNKKMHFGSIICKCNLVDCVYMTQEFVEQIKKNIIKNIFVENIVKVVMHGFLKILPHLQFQSKQKVNRIFGTSITNLR